MDRPIPCWRQGEVSASLSGKWANSAPDRASPAKLRTGFQFLTKDFLRFWTVDICQEISRRSAPQKRHTARQRLRRPEARAAGTGAVIKCTAPEESALATHLVA